MPQISPSVYIVNPMHQTAKSVQCPICGKYMKIITIRPKYYQQRCREHGVFGVDINKNGEATSRMWIWEGFDEDQNPKKQYCTHRDHTLKKEQDAKSKNEISQKQISHQK